MLLDHTHKNPTNHKAAIVMDAQITMLLIPLTLLILNGQKIDMEVDTGAAFSIILEVSKQALFRDQALQLTVQWRYL